MWILTCGAPMSASSLLLPPPACASPCAAAGRRPWRAGARRGDHGGEAELCARGPALAPAPGGGARGSRSCPPAAWLLERAACADGVRRGRRGGRRGQDPAGSGAPTSSAGIRWRHLPPWPAPLLAARRPATGAPPRCSHGGLEIGRASCRERV